MQTRRNIVLLMALWAVAAPTRVRAADASARSFVASIYNTYKGKSGNGIALDKEANVRRYFEPSLAALISADQKDAARRGEAPALGSDPFVDAQDWDIVGFDIAIRDTEPGKTRATVTFRSFDKPKTVELDLVKLKNDWRVADIAWQRDGKTATLRELFAGR